MRTRISSYQFEVSKTEKKQIFIDKKREKTQNIETQLSHFELKGIKGKSSFERRISSYYFPFSSKGVLKQRSSEKGSDCLIRGNT